MSKKVLCIILTVTLFFTIVLSACKCKDESSNQTDAKKETSQNVTQNEKTKEAEPIVLKVAADATALSEGMFTALFEGFQNAFSNVKLETDVAKDMRDKLAPLIASGDAPDIMYSGISGMYELMEKGKMMEFSGFYESKAFDADVSVKKSLISGADEAIVYKGKKYGVPEGPGFTGVVVNDKMFKENGWKVPTNWNELLEVSKEINAKDITPVAYGAAGGENRLEACFMTMAEYEVGGDQLIDDLDNMKPGAWGSKEMIKSFEMVKELVNNKVIDKKGLGMDPPQSQVAFLQGKYAMCLSGFWFEMEMKDQMKDMELGYIAFPTNKAGSSKQSVDAWFNTWTAWNTDNAIRKEAIWNYMKYLVGYEFQKKLATEGGLTVVANKRVMEEMTTDQNASYFTKAVAKCIADPNVKAVQQKYMGWYLNSFRVPGFIDIISGVVSGDITPEQAAEKAEELAEKLRNDDTIIKQSR